MKYSDLIPGQWYQIDSAVFTWIFKYVGREKNSVRVEKCATPIDGYIGGSGIISGKNIKEANIEEI